jgi:hypothetical protein
MFAFSDTEEPMFKLSTPDSIEPELLPEVQFKKSKSRRVSNGNRVVYSAHGPLCLIREYFIGGDLGARDNIPPPWLMSFFNPDKHEPENESEETDDAEYEDGDEQEDGGIDVPVVLGQGLFGIPIKEKPKKIPTKAQRESLKDWTQTCEEVAKEHVVRKEIKNKETGLMESNPKYQVVREAYLKKRKERENEKEANPELDSKPEESVLTPVVTVPIDNPLITTSTEVIA